MSKFLRLYIFLFAFSSFFSIRSFGQVTFIGEELLGTPTNNSITINIVVNTSINVYYEYGTVSGSYTNQTDINTTTANVPFEVVLTGLNTNTHYYYRMCYSTDGGLTWINRSEHSFWTQRVKGSTFRFDITSDSHATFNTAHQNAMTNVLNDQPDFLLDLGDTFLPGNASSQSTENNKYLAYRDPLYMDHVGHSVPIFLSAGNHEDEEGWNLDDTPFSPAVGSIQARKWYFPTPVTDDFYSGNEDPLSRIDETIYGDELREDYYAWEWGDVLFVVIDPFQYTMQNSYGSTAGEGSDDPATGDQWNWTLGVQQYNWFKQVIQNSTAKYKFVFSHNMVGGIPRAISVNPAGYVRGGAEAAAYFEWGGKNANGTDGFSSHRNSAEFGTTPIHQLMVENGVSAYFHGHDHQYVYETRDGIVYQEVPSPSMTGSGFTGIYSEGNHGDYNTIKMLPNSGHLRITITQSKATIDYISSANTNGTITYSYDILAPTITVNTKIFLQGPYSGSSMSTTLNTSGYIPTSQPYNTSPWNYSGTESVSSIPSGVVDWVLLELRSTTSGAAVSKHAAFIKSDGTIVDKDGTSAVTFNGVSAGNYYIVVHHRNHLAVMSSSAIALSNSSSLYDFTTGTSKYYGSDAASLGGSVYGMYAGDTDGNDVINFTADIGSIWNDRTNTGYKPGDTDMNGLINFTADLGYSWNNRTITTNVP
jgi:hypothetical protein